MRFRIYLLFSLVFILQACNDVELFDTDYCYQTGSFGNEIYLTQYYAFDVYHFNGTKENEHVTLTQRINVKEFLFLYEDSTFSKIVVDALGDTLDIQLGRFFIRNVPENGWVKNDSTYSFVLQNDSIVRKWIIDDDFHYKKIDSAITIANHERNVDTLLFDIQKKDSCFTLGSMELDDMYCPDKHIFTSGKQYCANSSYKDSSIVGVVIQ